MRSFVHVVVLVALVVASHATLRHIVEPNSHLSLPSGWSRVAEAPQDEILSLSIALHVSNKADLQSRFWAVSDPKSSSYAQYLSLEEIRSLYAPSPKSIAKVLSWLTEHGAKDISVVSSRDWIRFSLPVSSASTMLGVSFSHFSLSSSSSSSSSSSLPSKVITRAIDRPYSIPANLRDIIAFISPINRFPVKKNSVLGLGQRRQFGDNVTPKVIWESFSTNGTRGQAKNNLQSVAQFLGQFYSPYDLSGFQQNFGLPAQKVAKVVGPNDPSNPGVEATLDIEYITAAAPLVPTWFYSTAGLHEKQEPFVLWAQAMNNASLVPYVVSVSYGDPENTVTLDYAQRLDVEFQKLALRGVSILFASGDDGVGCHKSACVNEPNWPASSPYVTAVGGFVYQGKGTVPIGDTISSGGFSTFYARPSYQDAAVKAYLASGRLPPKNQFNATGRAIPDVSSFSENVAVYQGGGIEPVAGTSCAAPVFAGIISLVNDALLTANKKPLGFLNPALYGFGANTPSAFIDVVKGNNAQGCCQGFHATTGWDPITGWGGPNFPNLLAAFQSLQK